MWVERADGFENLLEIDGVIRFAVEAVTADRERERAEWAVVMSDEAVTADPDIGFDGVDRGVLGQR